jgi:hypothetical protein
MDGCLLKSPGCFAYFSQIRQSREAFVLKPSVFNSELFEATINKRPYQIDDWDDVCQQLKETSPDHANWQQPSQVTLLFDFNYDGVCVKKFNAQSPHLYPLLACITGIMVGGKREFTFSNDMPPFAIGYYLGWSKPPSCNKVISSFVDEMIKYSPSTWTGKVSLLFDGGICDRPAESDVKYTVNFNGFYGLSRCKQRGVNRTDDGTKTAVYFPDMECEPQFDKEWDEYAEPDEVIEKKLLHFPSQK